MLNLLYGLWILNLIWWQIIFVKPIVISFYFPKFWFFEPWAMTLPPFIFVNTKFKQTYPSLYYAKLLKHESRHTFQNRCLSPLIFLILYILMFAVNLFRFNFKILKQYSNIWFEKDAVRFENS